MKKIRAWAVCTAWAGGVALSGCATGSSAPQIAEAERFSCENDVAFTVRFADSSATVNSNRGYEVLYRTANGQAPGQTVYSNLRMRAEFSLGATGREATLRFLLQPVVVRCVRD